HRKSRGVAVIVAEECLVAASQSLRDIDAETGVADRIRERETLGVQHGGSRREQQVIVALESIRRDQCDAAPGSRTIDAANPERAVSTAGRGDRGRAAESAA